MATTAAALRNVRTAARTYWTATEEANELGSYRHMRGTPALKAARKAQSVARQQLEDAVSKAVHAGADRQAVAAARRTGM